MTLVNIVPTLNTCLLVKTQEQLHAKKGRTKMSQFEQGVPTPSHAHAHTWERTQSIQQREEGAYLKVSWPCPEDWRSSFSYTMRYLDHSQGTPDRGTVDRKGHVCVILFISSIWEKKKERTGKQSATSISYVDPHTPHSYLCPYIIACSHCHFCFLSCARVCLSVSVMLRLF